MPGFQHPPPGQLVQHVGMPPPGLPPPSQSPGNNLETITIRDLYVLMFNTRDEFRTSMQNIQAEVAALNASMANLSPRVEHCEHRIAKLEDDMDDKFKDQEATLTSIVKQQEDFPVDTTIVCTGLRETAHEDIYEKAQDLVENGLGLVNTQVEKAKRLSSRNDKPGLVKIRFPTVDDKIAALRAKPNLNGTGYRRVYLRSSQSHTDRIMLQNMQAVLTELPNGDRYRVTGHGKLVKKDSPGQMGAWSRGPHVGTAPANQEDRQPTTTNY